MFVLDSFLLGLEPFKMFMVVGWLGGVVGWDGVGVLTYFSVKL